jgi:hypothetical protein
MMIPETRQRLEAALSDLEGFVVRGAPGAAGSLGMRNKESLQSVTKGANTRKEGATVWVVLVPFLHNWPRSDAPAARLCLGSSPCPLFRLLHHISFGPSPRMIKTQRAARSWRRHGPRLLMHRASSASTGCNWLTQPHITAWSLSFSGYTAT